MLFDDAAIRIAATPAVTGSGAAPPDAMLNTNGSMSVSPTTPARP